MNKNIKCEVFESSWKEDVSIFSKEFENIENKKFDLFFKKIFAEINQYLYVKDLDTDKILKITVGDIKISGSFLRTFSSFWYNIDIENIKTGEKKEFKYNKDNCLFCPSPVVSDSKLKEILNLVKEIM